jgi:hypothetical protein
MTPHYNAGGTRRRWIAVGDGLAGIGFVWLRAAGRFVVNKRVTLMNWVRSVVFWCEGLGGWGPCGHRDFWVPGMDLAASAEGDGVESVAFCRVAGTRGDEFLAAPDRPNMTVARQRRDSGVALVARCLFCVDYGVRRVVTAQ